MAHLISSYELTMKDGTTQECALFNLGLQDNAVAVVERLKQYGFRQVQWRVEGATLVVLSSGCQRRDC